MFLIDFVVLRLSSRKIFIVLLLFCNMNSDSRVEFEEM